MIFSSRRLLDTLFFGTTLLEDSEVIRSEYRLSNLGLPCTGEESSLEHLACLLL